MKHSKTGWIITIIALLVIACGGIAIKLWPRTVPVEECSPAYKEYAGKPGIEVSFVKDYRINDTTFVDVTTLHATTDSAWNALCDDFISPHYSNEEKEIVVHGNSVTFFTVSRKNPLIRANPLSDNDIDFVALCPNKSTICFYHIENIDQITNIIFYNTNHLKK